MIQKKKGGMDLKFGKTLGIPQAMYITNSTIFGYYIYHKYVLPL